MVLVGAAVRQVKIITPDNQAQFSALIVSVTCPSLILAAAMNAEEHMGIDALITTYATYGVLLFALCVIGIVLPIVMGFAKELRGAVNLAFWFNNVLFMGLPLIQGVYGNGGVIYMTLYFIPVNLLFFSYGIMSINTGKQNISEQIKMLINPGVIASLLACVIYFGGIAAPYVISHTLTMIGALTAPLAMMMVGASLTDVDFRQMITNVRLLAYIVLKALVLPVTILLVMKMFIDDPFLLASGLIIVATPTGNMVPMVALLYNKAAYPIATQIVALTTLLAVVTIPLVAFLSGV